METLAGQRIKERTLNLQPISEYHKTSRSIDQTIDFIKSEFQKGKCSAYNVTVSGVNSFGYQLMRANQNEDALKIFQLNIMLHPNEANPYDSYGECLLKLNHPYSIHSVLYHSR